MKNELIALITIGALLGGCTGKNQQRTPPPTGTQIKKKPGVKVLSIKSQPIRTTIKVGGSPSNGIVITKAVEQGANVNARQLIMTIADLSELIVKTAVPER